MNDDIGILAETENVLICTTEHWRKCPVRTGFRLDVILQFDLHAMNFHIIKNRSGHSGDCVGIVQNLLNIQCVVEYSDHRYLRIYHPEDKVLAKIKYGHLF